jgi:hypothetical protein
MSFSLQDLGNMVANIHIGLTPIQRRSVSIALPTFHSKYLRAPFLKTAHKEISKIGAHHTYTFPVVNQTHPETASVNGH